MAVSRRGDIEIDIDGFSLKGDFAFANNACLVLAVNRNGLNESARHAALTGAVFGETAAAK